jgi:hypothetical protein
MKALITIFIVLILGIFNCFSQATPEYFIGLVPALPGNACTMKSSEKSDYLNKVSELSDQIKIEISKRKKALDKSISGNTEKMQQNMVQDMGLSPADIAKMKNGGKMSQAEAMALADKVMKNKYNMSVGEAKNVQKMSKEGKQAWGEAYSAEMMADAQANPEKYKADQTKNMNLFELVKEKKELAEKHLAMSSKFQQEFQELENDTSENKTLRDISKWTSEWYGMTGVDYGQGPKMTALANRIKAAKISYCNKLTPQFFDIYQRYLTYIKTSLPDFYRMEELEFKIMAAQTKVNNKPSEPGLMALQIVSEYISKLSDVFKYSLYSSDNDF